MAVYDTFQFNGEMDLLRLRCEELAPVVDFFIPVWADLDHQGNFAVITELPKDLTDQYPILEYTATNPPILPEQPDCEMHCAGYQAWRLYCSFMIEHWHREAIMEAMLDYEFVHVSDDDVILISDVDEIPSRDTVANRQVGGVGMHSFYYKLNCLADEPIIGTLKYPWWWWKSQTSIQSVREQRYQSTRLSGGWHFSWLAKSIDDVVKKFDMIAHVELATPENREKLPERYAGRLDPFGRWPERPLRKIGLEHLPHPVQEHPENWREYLDE